MQKLLCPYCDHEIKGKGRCDFCGSKVKKPVVAETSAQFQTQASANPNECDCSVHAPEAHAHDDTYRDSADASYQEDYEKAYGSDLAQGSTADHAGNGAGAPRRAVLASEAVERGKASGTIKPGLTTSQKVVRVIVAVVIIHIILNLIVLLTL